MFIFCRVIVLIISKEYKDLTIKLGICDRLYAKFGVLLNNEVMHAMSTIAR